MMKNPQDLPQSAAIEESRDYARLAHGVSEQVDAFQQLKSQLEEDMRKMLGRLGQMRTVIGQSAAEHTEEN